MSAQLLSTFQRRKLAALEQQRENGPAFGVGAYNVHGRRVAALASSTNKTANARRNGAAWAALARPPGFIGAAPAGGAPTVPSIPPGPAAYVANQGGHPPQPQPQPQPQPPGQQTYPVPMPHPGHCPPPQQTLPEPCPPQVWCEPVVPVRPFDECNSMGQTGGITMNCDTPQPCGANAIGQNTLGTNGIPPGEIVPVVITAGDAAKFTPKGLYFEAFPFSSPNLIDVTNMPGNCTSMPVYLVDALVGRTSQLRRGGSPNLALTQGAYSNNKPMMRVDWLKFTSTTEHNLTLLFLNPNANSSIHVNVVLTGDI